MGFVDELHSYSVQILESNRKQTISSLEQPAAFRVTPGTFQTVPLTMSWSCPGGQPSVVHAPPAHAGVQTGVLGAGGSPLQTADGEVQPAASGTGC